MSLVPGVRRAIAGPGLGRGLERLAFAAMTVLAATLPLEYVRPLVILRGLVLTNVETLLLLTLVLWAAARVAARRRPQVPGSVALPALAWLAVLIVSALLAPAHRQDAARFVARMIAAVLAAWAAYDLAQATGRRVTLLRALALGGLVVGLLGLAEATGTPAVMDLLAGFKEGPTMVGDVLRVSSTLAYATIASMVLELCVPLLLAWTLTARRGRGRLLPGAGLLAVLAAQVLTLTRGGLIALVAALGWMAAWAAWRRRRAVLVGSLATGAAFLALWGVVLIANPVARYRLVSETERGWYQAGYQVPESLTLDAGTATYVPVTATNTGVRTWQAGTDQGYALGYHLLTSDGTVIDFDGGHIALPHDVPPGGSVQVQALVTAPAVDGEYLVEWDMLQEGVTWFSWEGSAPVRTRLTVTNGVAGGAVLPDPSEAATAGARREGELTAGEQGRLWLWSVAAGMFVERPLLGVGPDNFRWLHGTFAGAEGADRRIHANNLYIEWLVDTGLLGLAAFLWLTWRLARGAYAGLARGPRAADHAIWQLAITASLVTWFAHGVLDFFYEFTPTYLAFALLCGLALVRSPLAHEEGRPCESDLM